MLYFGTLFIANMQHRKKKALTVHNSCNFFLTVANVVPNSPELKEANQMYCLQTVCEYDYELLNFATNFGMKFATFREKLCEINCNE